MTVSSGIAMEIHYCMGQKAGVEFFKTKNDKCSRCGMTEKNNGCCHDEHQFHKLEDSHKNVYNNISFDAGEITIVSAYSVYNWQLPAESVNDIVHNNSPPGYSGPSACIMHCVFRI